MTLEEKIKSYTDKEVKILNAKMEFEKLLNEYKAEMKADFGVCDGEASSVLQLVKLMSRCKEHA